MHSQQTSSDRPEPHEEGQRSFFISLTLEIVYSLTRLALLIALLALVMELDLKTLENSSHFKRVQQNLDLWQKQIIIDFQITNHYNCPQDYEEYTSYTWPGNTEGCLCSTSVGLWNYEIVLQGKCSEAEFVRDCSSVSKNDQIPYTFWKPEVHLCLKRLKNYNFYSSEQQIINPHSYPAKHCGFQEDHQIDLISVIDCPVTTLTNSSNLTNLLGEIGFSFEREDHYPIVDFKIAEEQFCQDFSKDNISPGRQSNYILEKRVKEECLVFDGRVQVVDQQSEVSLIRNNPRIEEAITQLPDYPQLSQTVTYKLGQVRYPAWSYSCRTGQQYDLMTTTRQLRLSAISSFFRTASKICLVILCIEFLYLFYSILSNYLHLKQKDSQGYLYLKDYQIYKINARSNTRKDPQLELLKLIVMQFFAGSLLVTLFFMYRDCGSHQDWFREAAHCTDASMGGYLLGYQQFFGRMVVDVVTGGFVACGLVLLDLVHFGWRKCKGDLEKESKESREGKKTHSDGLSDWSVSKVRNAGEIVEMTEQNLIGNVTSHLQPPFPEDDLLFELESPCSPQSESCYSDSSSEKED